MQHDFNFDNNSSSATVNENILNDLKLKDTIIDSNNIDTKLINADKNMLKKTVIASIIGNTLEWFEYCLYGQFALIISQTFFPKNNSAIILTWLIFAAGFITRPMGGVILGAIGDKFGRKSILSFSIIAMSLPTLGIGLLPSYEQIGIIAPILLLIFRCIQGFSMGGEFSSCITYMIENSPQNKRAFIGSFAFVSMCFGILLGIFTSILMSYYLSEEEIFEFGWRIPFISGIFMGIVGLYIRKSLSESPIYQKMKQNSTLSKAPLNEALKFHKNKIVLGSIIYMSVTTNFYMFTIYIQSMLQMELFQYTYSQIIQIISIGLISLSVSLSLFSILADKIGRKKILIYGLISLSIISPIGFYLFDLNNIILTLFAESLICISLGAFMSSVPAVLVEIFPANVRFTCIGISYNLSAAIFGGTLPIIASYLLNITNNTIYIQYYLWILNFMTLYWIYYKYTETKNISIN